jgi:hypothetical protein
MIAVYLRFPEKPMFEDAMRWVLPGVPRVGDFLFDLEKKNYQVAGVVWDMGTARVYIHLDKLE